MFAKISVKGKNAHPLYQYLTEATDDDPNWNFHKYLIDREGKTVTSIQPTKKVNEKEVLEMIEGML